LALVVPIVIAIFPRALSGSLSSSKCRCRDAARIGASNRWQRETGIAALIRITALLYHVRRISIRKTAMG
jgi:hypothetical protein